MAAAPRMGSGGLLICFCMLQLLYCSSSQQISISSDTKPSNAEVIVLKDTVTVTGRQTVGRAIVEASSSSTQQLSRTVIDCSQLQGKPAYLVRQGHLTLQNVLLPGCTHQAVVLTGPSASLTARNVMFSGHGSSSSSNHSSSGSQDSDSNSSRLQGIVISAQQATITLDRVVITGNKGRLPRGEPSYHPPCNGSSILAPASTNGLVCGSPVLASSLIHLQDSTLTARDTTIAGNTASAVISTSGSAQHSLQLLSGTRLQDNTAAWLIVADSFGSDPVGRENLLAPHPSQKTAKQKLRFRPVYTTYDFMWHLKSMDDWRKVLAQQVAQPKVLQYVGRAPAGQSPLQLQMRSASISQNTVTGGLMWLRTVNTSMHDVNISDNVALDPAVTPDTSAKAAGAVVTRLAGGMSQNLQPPHLCDVGALERALLQVQGAAASDMFRCNVSRNVHPAGAIIRVSDGVGLTSIRSSILSDNVATAVLRIDGRSWVHDAVVFMNATQSTDSSFYRQAEGTSEETYKTIWLPKHRTEQANYDKVSTDTACFVMDSRIERNAVFHAVVLAKGERVDWRSYEYAKARAALAQSGSSEAAADVTMETFNAANWWSGNAFANNTFIHAITKAAMQGIEAASYINALSFVLSGSRKARNDWLNRMVCEAALRSGSLENTTKTYNIKPAVFAATFGSNFLAGTIDSNVGFPHIVSMHSVTLVGSLQMRANVADTSVIRIMDASAGLYNSILENNRVQLGSVLQGDSFIGRLEQMTVAGNQAALDHTPPTPNSSNPQAGDTPAPTDAGAGAAFPSGSQGGAKWPIIGLQRIDLGILRNVTVANNTAPFWNLAIESNQWNFLEDIVGLVIHNNTASGIRLNRLQPYYDRQGWVLRDSRITGNKVTREAGALLLEGFNSRVGKVMPIALHNCVIANNTPSRGQQAPPKGGGIAIQGPTDDRADGSSDRGFLEFLNISISNSMIEGNVASEGGGVWSAWPMLVINTRVWGNTAQNAGGGFFLRGLQQDKLGLGNVVITNSSISNNTAQFGGAVACDSCRAFLYNADVSGNRAATELPTASAAVTNSSSACSNSSGGHGNVGSDDSCMLAAGQQQQGASPPVKGAVLGAGGAFAAVLKGRSFLRVCGASPNKPAAVTDNRAETVGGLMYMQYEGLTGCSAGSGTCAAAAQFDCTAGSDPSAQVFSQSSLCGVQLHNIDWSGTYSRNVGHVLAWAAGRQQPPFSVHCHAQSGNSSSGSNGGGSSAASCGCGDGFAAAHRRPGMPHLGLASNLTERLMWQLPNQMSVMHTGCLIELSNASRNNSNSQKLDGCLLADGRAVLPTSAFTGTPAGAAGGGSNSSPYSTFAGDAVNLTVALTRGLPDSRFTSAADAARIAPCGNSTDSDADDPRSNMAAVELQQDRTGGLFVIGKSRAVLDNSGLARFCNMALQPIDPPLYNCNYSFSIVADTSSGLLAQVPAVEVTVQLLRCTLGQHMTINRCVRCAKSGTFSLHPNQSCQPCVPGGLCSKGLLQPQEGFWSYNPFVPQVIPCPLKGACADRTITDQQLKLMVPWAAQAWQQQQQQGVGNAVANDAAARGHSAHQQLLQGPAQQPQGSETSSSSSSSSSSSTVPDRGGSSSDTAQKQWDRAWALQQYNRWLADLITYDPEQGPFRLYNVTYKGLLDSWQQVQCNKGYKGYMCSSCDTAYVDPESVSSSGSVQPRRFAFHRNQCVDCSTSIGTTWLMLFFLFLLFLGYVSLGMFCQIRSVDRDALQASSAAHTVGACSSRAEKRSGSRTLPCWQKCWQSGTSRTTAEATRTAVAGRGTWAQDTAETKQQQQQQLEGYHAAASDAAVCIGDQADRDQTQRRDRAGQGFPEPAGAGVSGTSPAIAAAAMGPAATGSGLVAAAAAAANAGSVAQGAQPQQQAAGRAGASVTAAAASSGGVSGAGASPVHTLVAMWKVLTSYAQILAMVRFLPSLWDTAAPLQFADLSSFFQFAAFDCILPGPPDKLAYTRILLTAFGVPALLFVVFLLAWIARWSLHRLGAVLHQRAISHSVVGKQHSAQGMPASGASSAVSGSAAVQPPPRAAAEVGPGAPASVRMGDVYRNVSSASGSGTPTVPASSSNSSSLPRSRSSWLPSAASSVIASVPSAALARLQTFGAQRPPVSLRRYLSVRLTITAVVLGYSCYSMFTSQMLQTLACHPIREVAGANDAAAGYGYGNLIKDFGDLHSRWLWERWQGLQAVSGARDLALEMPALCQGSKAASGAGTCQVSGQFWKQDYSVQCFQGAHAIMAGFGAVLLVVVGVFLPLLFGLLLWRNKHRLKEPLFTAKYSFLYHEYREQVCYWEFAIMARKLAFLGIFVALNPPNASPESVMLLQLYVAAALAVGALLLNVFLQPFELAWLNHLECAGLTAITLTFLLLGASVTLSSSPGGRVALLVLTGVGNFGLLCYFVWHMGRIVWQVFGGVVVAYLGNLRVRLSRAWHGQGCRQRLGCLP